MCLNTVCHAFENPVDEDWKIGYKVFLVHDGKTHFLYEDDGEDLDFGYIYTDKCTKILKSEFVCTYLTGYHLFDSKDAAFDLRDDIYLIRYYSHDELIVVEVKYRKVTAIGIDALGGDVIVAREMELIQICV